MIAITKQVRIQARLDQVYEALTRHDAYRGWWCTNSAVAEWQGGESLLHFHKDGHPVSMRFRVDEQTPDAHVHWTCVANDAPPWIGTTLSWTLSPHDEGGTVVALAHSGWKDTPPPAISEGWDHFVASLKSYIETGTGQPW